MVAMQYNVYLINLEPTMGHEIQKTLPCLVMSPDEMNDNAGTVIIAPMTTIAWLSFQGRSIIPKKERLDCPRSDSYGR